jgi:hypothetical protein
MAGISASIQDNISPQKEMEFLQESLKFIKDISRKLLLTQICIVTAQYYFQKVTYY